MNNEGINEVIDALKAKDNFLITAHINPEGDSIGSQLGIYYVLKKMGKKAVMVGDYNVPDNLKFLSETESILNDMPEGFRPDVGLVLDCPNKGRTGKVAKCLEDAEFIVNIDHHVSNEYFGDVNWVEPESSSVGEMICHIVQRMGIELDYDISSALYTAIVTDTGMFNYENTTKRTHETVGRLLESGINPKIYYPKEELKVFIRKLIGMYSSSLGLEHI